MSVAKKHRSTVSSGLSHHLQTAQDLRSTPSHLIWEAEAPCTSSGRIFPMRVLRLAWNDSPVRMTRLGGWAQHVLWVRSRTIGAPLRHTEHGRNIPVGGICNRTGEMVGRESINRESPNYALTLSVQGRPLWPRWARADLHQKVSSVGRGRFSIDSILKKRHTQNYERRWILY